MGPQINNAILAASSSLMALKLTKTTLNLVAGLLGVRLARRSRASVRHSVLAATFGALVALPLVSLITPQIPLGLAVAEQRESAPTIVIPATHAAPPPERLGREPVGAAADWQRSGYEPPDWLLMAWMGSAALFLLPMAIGTWQVMALRRSALPWRQGQARVDRLAASTGIATQVELLIDESLPGPMTCGLFRPAILLPKDAQYWESADLDRAIVHELEHVRRRDWMSLGMARVVCAVYWFHPLVWIAWRRLALEAERSCDDAVLANSEATAYADQLMGIAERISRARRSPVLAMANRSDLSTRIRAVLDSHQPRGRTGRFAVLAAVVASVFVLAMSSLRMVAAAQTAAETFRFDVASIRPALPESRGSTINNARNIFEIRNFTIRSLIQYAYSIHTAQLIGGPDWTGSERFDINAKSDHVQENEADPKRMSTRDQRGRSGVRALLEDRFQLKLRQESREIPVYSMTIDKGVHKLTPSASGAGRYSTTRNNNNRILMVEGLSTKGIAEALNTLERPVVDETGLDGLWDFNMTWSDSLDNDGSAPSLFTALREQTGLRLTAKKGVATTYVIEKVERPSEN